MTTPQAKTEHFHMIDIKGRLLFESKHENFRVALSDFLSYDDHGGIQLQITDMGDPGRCAEDVVVEMKLIRMKQNPQDHRFTAPRKRPAVVVKSSPTASDTCFY